MMMVIGFERELREAFAAGRAAAMSQFMANRKGAAEFFARTPKTYEEWIESKRDDPKIAIG
jgi:hypothetical protein